MDSAIDIATVTGPMLLGHLFNYALMGVLGLQVYIYSLSFPKDRFMIKVLVYSILISDILQTGIATHYAWYVLASGWGNPDTLRFTPWSLACVPPLAGSVAFMVQLFFSWRIWILGLKNKVYIPLLVIIIATALGSCVAAFYTGILSAKIRDVEKASELDKPVTGWLSASMVCDVIITVTLVLQLSARRSQGFSSVNHIIHRSIRMAIETGAVTSAVVIVELVLYLQSNLTSWYFMLGMVIGKLYSNSLLANLNARSEIFKGNLVNTENSGVQVWKATQPSNINTATTASSVPEHIIRENNIELGHLNDIGKNSSRNIPKSYYTQGEEDYTYDPLQQKGVSMA